MRSLRVLRLRTRTYNSNARLTPATALGTRASAVCSECARPISTSSSAAASFGLPSGSTRQRPPHREREYEDRPGPSRHVERRVDEGFPDRRYRGDSRPHAGLSRDHEDRGSSSSSGYARTVLPGSAEDLRRDRVRGRPLGNTPGDLLDADVDEPVPLWKRYPLIHEEHPKQYKRSYKLSDNIYVPPEESPFPTREELRTRRRDAYDDVKLRPEAPPFGPVKEYLIPHRFKGGFKDRFYNDPVNDISVRRAVNQLRRALYPESRPGDPTPKVNAYAVLDAASLISHPKRTLNLDPYLGDISESVSKHFANNPKGSKETPHDMKKAAEIMGLVVVREVTNIPPSTNVKQYRDSIRRLDKIVDQYAQIIIRQAALSGPDQSRHDLLFEALNQVVSKYSALDTFRMPSSLIAAMVLVWDKTRRSTSFAGTWFQYDADLLLKYLQESLKPVDLTETVSLETVQAFNAAHQTPSIPAAIQMLDHSLQEAWVRGEETEVMAIWHRFRDLLDIPSSSLATTYPLLDSALRTEVLTTFYYRLTARLFASGHTHVVQHAIQLDIAAEEVLALIPSPYPLLVLHGLVLQQTLPSVKPKRSDEFAAYPLSDDPVANHDVDSEFGPLNGDPADEASSEVSTQDNTATASQKKATRFDIKRQNLKALWKDAQVPGTMRDVKFYGLYIAAAGRLYMQEEIEEAWNAAAKDQEAKRLFYQEHEASEQYPPTHLYNGVITALLKIPHAGLPAAMELFEQGIHADSAIKCDIYTINVLIEYWGSQGKVDEMQKMLEAADARGIRPNAATFGSLIKGFAKAGQTAKVDEALKMMKQAHLEPSQRLLPQLVAQIARSGDLQNLRDAEVLIEQMRREGAEVNVFTWTALAGGYFRGGWEKDGWDAIRRMGEAGVTLTRPAYNLLLKEAGKRIEETEAPPTMGVKILQRMLQEGIHPGSDSFAVTLFPLAKKGHWNAADEVVTEMRKLRFAPEKQALKKLLFAVEWRHKLKPNWLTR